MLPNVSRDLCVLFVSLEKLYEIARSIMMSLHVILFSLCSVAVRSQHHVEWPEDLQQLMTDLHTSPLVAPAQSSNMNVVQIDGKNFLRVHIVTLDIIDRKRGERKDQAVLTNYCHYERENGLRYTLQ